MFEKTEVHAIDTQGNNKMYGCKERHFKNKETSKILKIDLILTSMDEFSSA